jgi:hypothetical protein
LLVLLLTDLLKYYYASLRLYVFVFFAMVVREVRLAGGCWIWSFAFLITEVFAGFCTVTAEEVKGWPTGVRLASVCVDGFGFSASASRRYVVTLRLFFFGERL